MLRKSNQNLPDMMANHIDYRVSRAWAEPSGVTHMLLFLWCLSKKIYPNHIKLDIKMCRHIHHSKWCGGASRCTILPQQSGYKTGFGSRLIIHNPVSREQTFLLKQFKGARLLLKPMDGERIEKAEREQLRKKKERGKLWNLSSVLKKNLLLFHTHCFLY